MRIARILPGIAVLNGHVFVCGGEVDSQILANGEIYDPHEDTWCEMASMTIPRCEFGEYLKSCSSKCRRINKIGLYFVLYGMYIPMNEKEFDPIVFVCRVEVGSEILAK